MPFVDGAQSATTKAKNIHFVGENPPGAVKTFQVLTFLPQLPPPARKHIFNAFNHRLKSSQLNFTTHLNICQAKFPVF